MEIRGLKMYFEEPDATTFLCVMAPLLDASTVWDVLDQRVYLFDTSGEQPKLITTSFPKCVQAEEMDKILDIPLVVINGIFTEYRTMSDIYLSISNYYEYLESDCQKAVFVSGWRDYEVYIKDADILKDVMTKYDVIGIKYTLLTDENDNRYTFRTSRY